MDFIILFYWDGLFTKKEFILSLSCVSETIVVSGLDVWQFIGVETSTSVSPVSSDELFWLLQFICWKVITLLELSYLELSFYCIRHYSHVTKNRIFKNLNLRKKADRNLCGNFLNNHFRQLKLYQIPQLIGQKSLSYGHLLKGKRLKFTMLREPTFQVLVRESSPPKKT